MTWDYQHMIREPSVSYKLYILFLLTICVVGIVKLWKVWRSGLSSKRDSPAYIRDLQISASSLRQWIGLTFLGWGIFASVTLVNLCYRLLDEKVVGLGTFLLVLIDYATTLSLALFAIALLYLIRWHILQRIQRLGLIR